MLDTTPLVTLQAAVLVYLELFQECPCSGMELGDQKNNFLFNISLTNINIFHQISLSSMLTFNFIFGHLKEIPHVHSVERRVSVFCLFEVNNPLIQSSAKLFENTNSGIGT